MGAASWNRQAHNHSSHLVTTSVRSLVEVGDNHPESDSRNPDGYKPRRNHCIVNA